MSSVSRVSTRSRSLSRVTLAERSSADRRTGLSTRLFWKSFALRLVLASVGLPLVLTPAIGQSQGREQASQSVIDYLTEASEDPPLDIAHRFITGVLSKTRAAAPRDEEYWLESQYVSPRSASRRPCRRARRPRRPS